MSKKYKLILTIIIIAVLSLLLIGGGYLIYKKHILKNTVEVVVDDNLSINYKGGKNIEFDSDTKKIDFSVINDSDTDTMFHINFKKIKYDGKNVTYELYENNKKVVNNKKLKNNSSMSIYDFISIKGNETKNYSLVINNPSKKNVKCELLVEKSSIEERSFSAMILNNNSINKEPKTKVGEEIAVTDEGLIADVDDLGNTYYFRGATANNYVSFADRTWRIVRINGNGSVRIVLDSDISGGTMYSPGIQGDKLDKLKNLTDTNIYSVLNKWYDDNLKNYDEFIFSDRFCIDTTKEGENLSNYNRINQSNNPTFNCLGTKNSTKIGLLTIDEIIYAGASINEGNNHFYLYNDNIAASTWTLSPFKDAVEGIYYYELTQNGDILNSSTGESSKSIRPVININKDVEVEGKGTKEEPYVIK